MYTHHTLTGLTVYMYTYEAGQSVGVYSYVSKRLNTHTHIHNIYIYIYYHRLLTLSLIGGISCVYLTRTTETYPQLVTI